MVDLNFTGMCKQCNHADLELECIEFNSVMLTESKKEWSVKCIHADACSAMRNSTIARLEEDE